MLIDEGMGEAYLYAAINRDLRAGRLPANSDLKARFVQDPGKVPMIDVVRQRRTAQTRSQKPVKVRSQNTVSRWTFSTARTAGRLLRGEGWSEGTEILHEPMQEGRGEEGGKGAFLDRLETRREDGTTMDSGWRPDRHMTGRYQEMTVRRLAVLAAIVAGSR